MTIKEAASALNRELLSKYYKLWFGVGHGERKIVVYHEEGKQPELPATYEGFEVTSCSSGMPTIGGPIDD